MISSGLDDLSLWLSIASGVFGCALRALRELRVFVHERPVPGIPNVKYFRPDDELVILAPGTPIEVPIPRLPKFTLNGPNRTLFRNLKPTGIPLFSMLSERPVDLLKPILHAQDHMQKLPDV